MKLVILSLYHPQLFPGGAQQVAYDVYEAAAEDADIDAYFVASVDEVVTPGLRKPGGVINGVSPDRPNEFLFFMSRFDHFWQSSGDPYVIEELLRFLESINPDLISLHHTLTWGVDLIAAIRSRFPNARMVLTFHEFISICHSRGQMVRNESRELCDRASPIRCNQCFPTISPDRFLVRERWIKHHLQQLDAFITPTRFLKERYVDWGLPATKIHVVSNGINWPSAHSTRAVDVTSNYSRFSFFGQMVDNKGADILLKALLKVDLKKVPDLECDLYGGNLEVATSGYKEEFEQLSKEVKKRLGDSRIRFHGRDEQRQLGDAMARTDWVVVPSRWWEIFCLVVSEAWAAGRPVIASDIGGLKERISHGKEGLKFAVDDPWELAALIEKCAGNKEQWEGLVSQIPDTITHHDMWQGYKGVLNSAGAG